MTPLTCDSPCRTKTYKRRGYQGDPSSSGALRHDRGQSRDSRPRRGQLSTQRDDLHRRGWDQGPLCQEISHVPLALSSVGMQQYAFAIVETTLQRSPNEAPEQGVAI